MGRPGFPHKPPCPLSPSPERQNVVSDRARSQLPCPPRPSQVLKEGVGSSPVDIRGNGGSGSSSPPTRLWGRGVFPPPQMQGLPLSPRKNRLWRQQRLHAGQLQVWGFLEFANHGSLGLPRWCGAALPDCCATGDEDRPDPATPWLVTWSQAFTTQGPTVAFSLVPAPPSPLQASGWGALTADT